MKIKVDVRIQHLFLPVLMQATHFSSEQVVHDDIKLFHSEKIQRSVAMVINDGVN